MNDWRKSLEALFPDIVSVEGLPSRSASATGALCASPGYAAATLIECRVNADAPGSALLLVEVDVPLGQRKAVNDVRAVEPVALYFQGGNTAPLAYPLRDDFPEHLPHLNASWDGEPRSLCLFEMPSEEVLRIATPHVMMERIRWWLAESAHGRLHGEHQPLDPVFAISGRPLVLPPTGLAGLGARPLAALCHDEANEAPVFLVEDTGQFTNNLRTYSAVVLTTPSLANGGVRRLPRTLADLVDIYVEAGIDLAAPLRGTFRRWLGRQDLATALGRPCLLVVATPLERRPGHVERIDTKAFHTGSKPTSQVAAAVGALFGYDGRFSVPIPDVTPDVEAMRAIEASALDVHGRLDRGLARAANGREGEAGDDRAVTLVGAGALGSQLALCAARMGIGRWMIVDPDYLLPHNLARHGLHARHVGMAKATAVAGEIQAMIGADAASGVVCDVEDPRAAGVLADRDMIVDASASVPVARWLALRAGHAARTTSVFLNPKGDDLVVLKEGAGRVPRIDHVEMTFHWLIATDDRLDGHYAPTVEGIHPSGGCRSPSLRIPQSRIGSLVSFALDAVFSAEVDDGAIEVVRHSPAGVEAIRFVPPRFKEVHVAGISVCVSDEALRAMVSARNDAADLETGGILVGSWDRQRDAFYLVAALDPPPDSVSSRTGFVRGCDGVYATLDDLERRTAANLTYVGEWHSHPAGHGTSPSSDDHILLEWIGDVLAFSDVPACMAIVGDEGVRIVLGVHKRYAVIPMADISSPSPV